MSNKYIAEIDGIRAIAVLGVLLYHLDVTGFKGGFVGVDVFFVISGFLITGILARQTADGTFSFAEFYKRRARRLLPSLFATILLTQIAAIFILSPEHLTEFSRSSLAASLFSSNIFFWTQSGYFDSEAIVKPLLHTWSLAIEEQFYLFWPFVIILLAKKNIRFRFTAMAVITALSVAINHNVVMETSWLKVDASSLFFLLPFRIFEFALGAILVFIPSTKNSAVKELCNIAGLSMIVYSIHTYDPGMVFPTLNGILPCLGTSLMIYGCTAKFTGSMLKQPFMVWIGKLSYTLYLAHWPIIVFYRYGNEVALTTAEQMSLGAASLIASILMTRLVENPFRYSEKTPITKLFGYRPILISVSVLLVGSSVSMHASEGWPWRLSDKIRSIVESTGEVKRERSKFVNARDTGFDSNSLKKVLIVGDSHGSDFFNAIESNRQRFEGIDFGFEFIDEQCFYKFMSSPVVPKRMSGFQQKKCDRTIKDFFASDLPQKADHILIATRWIEAPWNDYGLKNVPYFAEWVDKNTSAQLTLLSKSIVFSFHPPTKISTINQPFITLDDVKSIVLAGINKRHLSQNEHVKKRAEELGLGFLSRDLLYCPGGFPDCTIFDDSGNLMYIDKGHLSMSGARLIGQRAKDNGFFDDLLSLQ